MSGADTPRSRQKGESKSEREEKWTVTRIPAEDPEVVRERDNARLDGIGRGTDPLTFLGDGDE